MAHCGLWHTHTSLFPSSVEEDAKSNAFSGFLMQTNEEGLHWKYTNVFCHVDVLLKY